MPKFFVDIRDISGDIVTISNQDAVHIKKVLRLSQKDNIIVCDGQGTDYCCEILDTGKTAVTARILSSSRCLAEPRVTLTLFQGIPKGQKMELIIQKAVELGVHSIVPVEAKRTVVKLEDKMAGDAKVARWQRVSLEAAKQCGRGIVPQVHYPVTFEQSLDMLSKCGCPLMAYEKGPGTALRDVIGRRRDARDIGILIGPEGGFEDREAEAAKALGVSLVGLGNRILRTETAPLAVISIVMYEYGEI